MLELCLLLLDEGLHSFLLIVGGEHRVEYSPLKTDTHQ